MLKSFLKMFLIPFSLRRGSTKNSRLLIKSAGEKNYFKGPLQEQRLIMEMWFTTTMGLMLYRKTKKSTSYELT